MASTAQELLDAIFGAPDQSRITPALSASGDVKPSGVPGMANPNYRSITDYTERLPSEIPALGEWNRSNTSPSYWSNFYRSIPYAQATPKYTLTPPGLGGPVAPVWPASTSMEAYYPGGPQISGTIPGGNSVSATTPAALAASNMAGPPSLPMPRPTNSTWNSFAPDDPMLAENGVMVGPDGRLVPIPSAAPAKPATPAAATAGLPIPVQGPNGYWYIPKPTGGYIATHKTNLYDVPGFGVSWQSPNFGSPGQPPPLFGGLQGSPAQKAMADMLRLAQGPGGLIGEMIGTGPGQAGAPKLANLLFQGNPAQKQAAMASLNPAQRNAVINGPGVNVGGDGAHTYDIMGNDNAFNPASVANSARWQTGY